MPPLLTAPTSSRSSEPRESAVPSGLSGPTIYFCKIVRFLLTKPERSAIIYIMVQAIRYDVKQYSIGDILPPSRVWVDGDPTDEVLPGTSVLLPFFDSNKGGQYQAFGEHKYIVEGRYVQDGYDDGEVVLAHCVVIEVLD